MNILYLELFVGPLLIDLFKFMSIDFIQLLPIKLESLCRDLTVIF